LLAVVSQQLPALYLQQNQRCPAHGNVKNSYTPYRQALRLMIPQHQRSVHRMQQLARYNMLDPFYIGFKMTRCQSQSMRGARLWKCNNSSAAANADVELFDDCNLMIKCHHFLAEGMRCLHKPMLWLWRVAQQFCARSAYDHCARTASLRRKNCCKEDRSGSAGDSH